MKRASIYCSALVLVLGLAMDPARANEAERAAADVRVAVKFSNPERFTDASLDDSRRAASRARVTAEISQALTAFADRALPVGDQLKVTITDIDLAGRVRPGAIVKGENVRLLDDVSWPRITLSYEHIGADGVRLASAENVVVENRAYLMGPTTGISDDPLRHEKALLSRWVRQNFSRADGN